MFNSILGSSLTLVNFIICILASFVLGLIVALVHSRTTKTSRNFVSTLAILPTLVSIVILLVNGNLGTGVAVASAFSLIRFRSVPGNSKEILSVFFAMAIGLAVGTGYIGFAIMFTLFTSFIIVVLDKIHFGEDKTNTKILKIVIPENLDYTNCFDDLLDDYTNENKLIVSKTTNMGSMFELTYNVVLKNNINEKEFIDKIRVRNGNLKVSLTHPLVEQEL